MHCTIFDAQINLVEYAIWRTASRNYCTFRNYCIILHLISRDGNIVLLEGELMEASTEASSSSTEGSTTPRKLPALPWKQMEYSTDVAEASVEGSTAFMEAAMFFRESGFHGSFRGMSCVLPRKLPPSLWRRFCGSFQLLLCKLPSSLQPRKLP